MKKYFLLHIVFLLIAPIFLTEQIAFAGQIGCQTGAPVTPTPRLDGLYQQEKEKHDQRQLAAQFRNAQNPSSGGEC